MMALLLAVALWLVCAISAAPGILGSSAASTAKPGGGDKPTCTCAHCPGGALCCCRNAGHLPDCALAGAH